MRSEWGYLPYCNRRHRHRHSTDLINFWYFFGDENQMSRLYVYFFRTSTYCKVSKDVFWAIIFLLICLYRIFLKTKILIENERQSMSDCFCIEFNKRQVLNIWGKNEKMYIYGLIKECVDNHCLDVCHISIVYHTQNAVAMTGTNIIYFLHKYCIIFILKEKYRSWNLTN